MSLTLEHSLSSPMDAATEVDWYQWALCHGDQVAYFMHECRTEIDPDTGDRYECDCNSREVVVHCKEQCARCPVLMWCRVWSVMTAQQYGIAGGWTESERRMARRIIVEAGVELVNPHKSRRSVEW